MDHKSTPWLLLLLLVSAATAQEDDQWSWGSESSRKAKDISGDAPAPGVATFSVSVSPEEPQVSDVFPEEEEERVVRKTLDVVDPLPLEPHASYSVDGEDGHVVDGLVVAGDGSREGRFLGIGEKLCSYGIGINCDKKYPAPVKSHYGVPHPKPTLPHTSYGPPHPKPVAPHASYGVPSLKPTYPNRKHGSLPPTKAPSYPSPLKGLLSVLEPFMPGSKPKIPPKVGHSVLSPSYTAPNPNYAPLLPSYYPPVKPTHTVLTPTYHTPRPAYPAPTPSYVAPKPDYVAPQKPYVVNTKPVHVAQKVDYVPPKPHFPAAGPPYVAPKPSYHEPKPAYANAIPTYTVASIQPTVIEHHTHSHTHVYQDDSAHQDIYHGQGSQHVFQRQDLSHGVTHGKNQGSVKQVVEQSVQHGFHQDSANDHSLSVVSTQIVSENFKPGEIETGFRPLASVPQPLYQQLAPTYREDCQCVPTPFCSDQDIVARSAPHDIRQLLDARNRGSDILSNDTESNVASEIEVTTGNSVRRGRVLDLTDERVMVTTEAQETDEEVTEENTTEAVTEVNTTEAVSEEETTEAVTEAPTVNDEETRVRREADDTDDTSDTPDLTSVPNDRQGRQLTGFTPGSNGCGSDHVCCRRPVFKPRRQKYACGRRNAAGLLGRVKTSHFVEGDSEFGEYPWQAAILRREKGDIMYQCGAALIDDRHVLTAAHCIEGLHPTQLKVRLGEWDVSGQSEFYDHVELRAAGVYTHPEYYNGNLHNDIAVIRLEAFVDFSTNPHITPVCLPSSSADFTHHRCFATGWGKDAFGSEGKFSHILKEVELPVVEGLKCEALLRQTRLGRDFALHEGNLCAGGEQGKDTCKGDGGGPLVCSGPDGSVQLAGLVSWGIGCGHPGVPGVYVNVAHYLDWLRAITKA
ncbi:uncharacterized protein [Panulirus ornatus]|uniref:uncharacterized protein n=1 Tax=Panulirus ornatus TaxID=150431 RepID=UPI003A882A91